MANFKTFFFGAEPLSPVHHSADNKQCFVSGVHAFVLRMTSIFGFAPLRFKPHGNGYTVSLSKYMCIYGYIMICTLVVITLIKLVLLATYGITTEYMSTAVSKVMFTFDFVMVPMMVSFGIYGAPSRMRRMLKLMDTIALVDKSIGALYSHVNERSIWTALIFFLFFSTALIVHNLCYFLINTGAYIKCRDVVLQRFLWYQLMILDVQFAFTVMSVQRRFKAVNEALSLTARHLSVLNTQKAKSAEMLDVHAAEVSLNQSENATVIVKKSATGKPRLVMSSTDAVHNIAFLHGALCEVVHVIDQCYSTPLIITLMSSLLHLVVTPYFTLLEIYNQEWTNHLHFLILANVWLTLLILRLFMVVEPCHYTVVEGKKTESLVCQMLLKSPTSGPLSARLELFWRQLMMHSLSFNPMGLCILDRPLIASIFGAVATYLVILIQFQGTSV